MTEKKKAVKKKAAPKKSAAAKPKKAKKATSAKKAKKPAGPRKPTAAEVMKGGAGLAAIVSPPKARPTVVPPAAKPVKKDEAAPPKPAEKKSAPAPKPATTSPVTAPKPTPTPVKPDKPKPQGAPLPKKPVTPTPTPKAPVLNPVSFKPKPISTQPARPSFPPRPPASFHPPRRRSGRKKRHAEPKPEPISQTPEVTDQPEGKKKFVYNEMMTVQDLANAMDVKVPDVIRKLLSLGSPATINQRLETETATLLADSFGYEIELKSIYNEEEVEEEESEENLKSRSPVVTVMGHVDHGKTSLLDAIRSARVAEKEAGGITQHIGAYQVTAEKGTITFLDTPGHEAFTAMRARGAVVTDLVVLVVAADDSVMPQTVEAIDHAKAAGVPIVVAVNKIDLPGANVQKVKQELSQHNLLSEDWGGKTQMVEVSAKTKHNIDELLEMILLEAEILELKSNPDRPAKAVVLEARLDPRRGPTSTVLLQSGTLRVGDVVVCGLVHGRIRAMLDDHRRQLNEAGPAVPVEILGLGKVPHVGDQLSVVRSDREAREIAERRGELLKDSAKKKQMHMNLESLHAQIEAGNVQELNVILKADVQGSLQAIQDSLGKLSTPTLQVRFIHVGVGNINDSDVLLAETSNSILFGFHVKIESSSEAEAKRAGVDFRLYNIIYEMVADVRAALEGLLKPVEVEVVKGRALVKATFPSARHGQIAGCLVQEGTMIRGHKAKLIRGEEVIAKGVINTLRRFKEDVRDVDKGYECGITIEGNKKYQPDDIIEDYVIEKQARRLED